MKVIEKCTVGVLFFHFFYLNFNTLFVIEILLIMQYFCRYFFYSIRSFLFRHFSHYLLCCLRLFIYHVLSVFVQQSSVFVVVVFVCHAFCTLKKWIINMNSKINPSIRTQLESNDNLLRINYYYWKFLIIQAHFPLLLLLNIYKHTHTR